MLFGISKEVTGLDYDLIWIQNNRFVSERKHEKHEAIILTKDDLKTIERLYLCKLPVFPPENFRIIYNKLSNFNQDNIPWPSCMPKDLFLKEVSVFGEKLNSILEQETNNLKYYSTFYKNGNVVFQHLQPAKINEQVFNSLAEKHSDDPHLMSFKPTHGFARNVSYSRQDTVTGRLKIMSGPNVLHLRKEYRSQILTSRFGQDGAIYEFDYKSLEPRVLLAIKGLKEIPVDIYEHLQQNFFQNHPDLTKDRIKNMGLSFLYGGNPNNIFAESTDSPRGQDVDGFMNVFNEYFGVEDLKKRLLLESERNGYVTNLFGRRVDTRQARNSILVNYWNQSTAMDLACLGFSKATMGISQYLRTKLVFPLFLVTDAFYLDIHNSVADEVNARIIQEGSKGLPKFENVEFFLKVKKL